jgi:MFS family permease
MNTESITTSSLSPDQRCSAPTNQPLSAAFYWLWGGQSVSLAGSKLSSLSFQLVAVTTLHASVSQMGVLGACDSIPYLLLGVFIGAIIDRTSRQQLLIQSALGGGGVLLVSAIVTFAGYMSMHVMWVVACLIGTSTLLSESALNAFIPEVLLRQRWLDANSRLAGTQALSEVVGPGLAGYLLQWVAAPFVMLIDGCSYGISAGLIFLTRPDGKVTVEQDRASVASSGGFRSSIRAGIGFVFADRVLKSFVVWSSVWNFSWNIVLAVYVLYATTTLGLGPTAIGIIFAAGGIGGMVGSSVAMRLVKRFPRGTALVVSPLVGACGGLLLLCANGPHAVPISATAMFLFNLGEMTYVVNMITIRQEITPVGLMGRMDMTMKLCFRGMYALGALAGGILGSREGLRTALLVGVYGLFLTVVGLYGSGLMKLDAHQKAELR